MRIFLLVNRRVVVVPTLLLLLFSVLLLPPCIDALSSPPTETPARRRLRDRLSRSILSPRDTVQFFPTAAHWDSVSNLWQVPIHGWVYDPETHSLKRKAFVQWLHRTVTKNSSRNTTTTTTTTTNHGTLDDEASLEQEELPHEASLDILNRRVRPFLVDNHRRRKVTVQLCDTVHEIAQRSRKNGHFFGTLPVGNNDIVVDNNNKGVLDVYALSNDRLGRHHSQFAGRVTLVPPTGLSILSDIDDTVKLTKVGDTKQVLKHTFLREFQPVPGMAQLYQKWYTQHDATFHYVSSSPWQLYPELERFFTAAHFPVAASFHLKSIRLKDRSLWSLFEDPMISKAAKLSSVLTRFPGRQFVLVGDSGERDPEIYGHMYRQFPQHIQRILIRNVSESNNNDDDDSTARYQEAFANVPTSVWTVFDDPKEIMDLKL